VLAAVAGDFFYQSLFPVSPTLPTHQHGKGTAALNRLCTWIS
jgi:hypothetical protein